MRAQDHELGCYVDKLMKELQGIGAELPPDFRGRFLRYAQHLPGDSYGDLGSLFVIECLEAKQEGAMLDQLSVKRGLDRVRKRLTREIARSPQPLVGLQIPGRDASPDQRAILLDTLRHALSGLTADELLVLEWWADGWTSSQVAKLFGMNATTFRQRAHRALARLKAAVEKGELTDA
jgi:DNA-binding CsgD family transcriptional regulator